MTAALGGKHVAGVEMPPVHHQLHGVRPAADIAVGQVPDAVSNALWRDRRLCRRRRLARRADKEAEVTEETD
jgi:hypothetical protein